MSSIYWFMIIFLLVAIIVTVVYIFLTRTSDVKCCYKNDDSYCVVLTPSPAGCAPASSCHVSPQVKCGNNDRDFYAMVICLGVILAIMITVFILFIYMSGGENKTPPPKPVVEVTVKKDTSVLPSPTFDATIVSLPPPMISSPEDYVRLGTLGCKKRSSCRKAPKFKVVTV